MFWIEFLIVLAAIFLGSRIGGIGLGAVAALGLAVLVFLFRLPAGTLPVDVIFIIVAVVTAAGALEAALVRLLGDDALRAELGRRGREVAAEYSWRNVAQLQAEIYERVV